MDADGQHPPALIEKLVATGSTAVTMSSIPQAHRENEPRLLQLAVKCFYSLINWGARQKSPRTPATSGCCRRAPPAALRQMPERNRFFKGLASWNRILQFARRLRPATRIHGRTAGASIAHRPVGRRPDVVLGGAVAACELLGILLASGALGVQASGF